MDPFINEIHTFLSISPLPWLKKTFTYEERAFKFEDYSINDSEHEDGYRLLKEDELDQIAYQGCSLTLCQNKDFIYNRDVIHVYERSHKFTIRAIFDCLLDFERKTRKYTTWCDGYDFHHLFFEGFEKLSHDTYRPIWGS